MRTMVKLAAAGVFAAGLVLGGGSAASASSILLPEDVIEVPAYFSGSGSGSTFEEAVANAQADAQAKAAAAGYTNCVLDDVINVGVLPGDPPTFIANLTLICTR
jgi:hypothetical protein